MRKKAELEKQISLLKMAADAAGDKIREQNATIFDLKEWNAKYRDQYDQARADVYAIVETLRALVSKYKDPGKA